MGVSVEDQAHTFRIDHLKTVPAAVKFVSFEPLIAPITKVSLKGIDWAIVGGESGPGSRQSRPDWFRCIRSACRRSGTAFFFKQYGDYAPVSAEMPTRKTIWLSRSGELVPSDSKRNRGDIELANVRKKNAGRILDGQTWDEYPAVTS